jgi:hypothetical protein
VPDQSVYDWNIFEGVKSETRLEGRVVGGYGARVAHVVGLESVAQMESQYVY